ncbi:MAG: diguanylate cyclase [Bacillota bacterium]
MRSLQNFNQKLSKNKIIFSRTVLTAITILFISFGFLYKTNIIKASDYLPLSLRIIISVFLTSLIILSFSNEKIKKNIYLITLITSYVSLVHLLFNTYYNDFYFTLAVIIIISSLLLNATFQMDRSLLTFNIFFAFLLLTLLINHQKPVINPVIYFINYLVLNILSYIINFLNNSVRYKYKDLAKKYNTILNNTTDSVVLIDIKDGKYKYNKVNKAYKKHAELPQKQIISKTPKDLYGKEYGDFIKKKFQECIEKKEAIDFDEKIEKDNKIEYWHTKLSPVISKGEVKQLVGISRNITEKKKATKKIKKLTYKDSLTGLYNKNYFQKEMERFNEMIIDSISIIIGDVNGLKLANDAFGHNAGDKLLKKMAEKIENSCRAQDIITRWGGDEFVILLPHTAYKGAKKVTERIKNEIDSLNANPIEPSIALGFASRQNSNEDLNEVFKRAENIMYKNKLSESQNMHTSIIDSLKNTFHKNTCESKEHCNRLKNLAVSLGEEIGLAANLIEKLKLLAEMHDIGKVAISKDIIHKKDKLTQKEWNEIKRHSEIGYQIANTTPKLSSIADGILHHHERWDGKGYPLGKKGKEIPITARIINIVDAYDIMLSKRPYKNAFSQKRAIDNLKREAGKQFDPKLVDIFINKVINYSQRNDNYDSKRKNKAAQ